MLRANSVIYFNRGPSTRIIANQSWPMNVCRVSSPSCVILQTSFVLKTSSRFPAIGIFRTSLRFSGSLGKRHHNSRILASDLSEARESSEDSNNTTTFTFSESDNVVQKGPTQSHSSSSTQNSAADQKVENEKPSDPELYFALRFVTSIIDAAVTPILNSSAVKIITRWPAWQQKKLLDKLEAEADAFPADGACQSAYLRELNKVSPQAVMERFERREYAVEPRAVVEYMKALVVTNRIADYLPEGSGDKNLPVLLEELKLKAAGGKAELAPGSSEQQPSYVMLVEGRPKAAPNRGVRWLQELTSTLLMVFVAVLIWSFGAHWLRKYVSGVAGVGSSSGGIGSGQVYSPKEYSKDALPEKSVKTFRDVKGCDEAKEELEEIVQYLKDPTKFTRLGGKLPKGVLLIGPPGTGKTLLAKAIAGEAGVPFFYRAGSEFEEMFVGVGARRVRSLFQAAKKKAPCIVFIDEIDAVGGSRKQWEGHTKKTLNQLLVEMDGFEANEGIIVLAATNLPETLDPALVRPGRFDRRVVVPTPDVRGRQEILEMYLQDKPVSPEVDKRALARGTPGFSGADLANLVNMAAVKAAVDGSDLIFTKQLEFAKDRILMGAERRTMALTEDARRKTAYHESGHAVVALRTPGAMPIHKATIMPRGEALGMVMQLPDQDETSQSLHQMLARLDVCMGGRVAEELVFGPQNVTSGARSDLRQATSLARHMVAECGMSPEVGPVFVDAEGPRLSADMQRRVDAEVVRLLKEAYERVRQLLKKHESDLHALAKALMESETMNAQEINTLLSISESDVGLSTS